MELIAAVLVAGPLGYFVQPSRRALMAYLVVWAVIFPIQTVVVLSSTEPGSNDYLYWVFNAVILAGGIALNRLGAVIGGRRRRRSASESASARAPS